MRVVVVPEASSPSRPPRWLSCDAVPRFPGVIRRGPARLAPALRWRPGRRRTPGGPGMAGRSVVQRLGRVPVCRAMSPGRCPLPVHSVATAPDHGTRRATRAASSRTTDATPPAIHGQEEPEGAATGACASGVADRVVVLGNGQRARRPGGRLGAARQHGDQVLDGAAAEQHGAHRERGLVRGGRGGGREVVAVCAGEAGRDEDRGQGEAAAPCRPGEGGVQRGDGLRGQRGVRVPGQNGEGLLRGRVPPQPPERGQRVAGPGLAGSRR